MANEKSKPAQVWGKRAAEFYTELENKTVLVAVSNGKVFKGALVGVDVYDILIRQASGLELLLPKGNIIYIHRVKE
jgi:sRNA-binding regulator protein Hfq